MKIRGLLLDVEGVLVGDKRYRPVPTAIEFVAAARAAGCPLRLVTNNTSDDRQTLHDKLRDAGFDFTLDELHTCTAAAARYLAARDAKSCLVLGNATLQRIFADEGLAVKDDAVVDAVVVGLDTALTYARLQRACEAVLSHGAQLVALHHNRLYVDEAGRPAPSVGAIASAIEYATQSAAAIIGKPSPAYYQQALDEIAVNPRDVLMVSDDPLSDLAGAKTMGMHTAFMLSGKYADEAVLSEINEDQRPDVVAGRLGDLLTRGGVAFA
jgi:HAD superfamily hydrolase (TIGR01458 family)